MPRTKPTKVWHIVHAPISNDLNEAVWETAHSYLDGIHQDLQEYGGVQVSRIEPLRVSKKFAIAVFDATAVLLARKYDMGTLDFEAGDWLANTIEGEVTDLMIEFHAKEDFIEKPTLWSEVYQAFDAGEFDHFGSSKNPVQEHTDPLIKEFLRKFEEAS